MADNTHSVVLVGGGHTHALVLHALKAHPLKDAQITVINPGSTAPYSGMLPGFVAGHYQRYELDIDLAALTEAVGAQWIDGRAVAMDPVSQCVRLDDGSDVPYTVASLDVGITSRMSELPGFADHAVPAKPLGPFSEAWDAYRSQPGEKSVAVIGGGIAGAELAMAMSFALRQGNWPVSVHLLDRGQVLATNTAKAQARVKRALETNAIEVHENADVVSVTADGVKLVDGSSVAAEFVVGAAGATPHEWLGDTGLALSEGFVIVNESLQTSAPAVFAVGDCAHMAHDPRPKAGVYAVRQAPVLLANLRRALAGGALQSYSPQTDYLKLVSLGGKRAFGEKNGFSASGHLMWRLKDRIDRAFMSQF